MENFDNIEIRVADLIRRCEKQYTPQFTGFLTSEEQAVADRLARQSADVFVLFIGGFSGAERCVAGFFPCDIYLYPENESRKSELEALAELQFVEIAGSGFVNISHRDVLGSVMALGIKRETVGDIVVADDNKTAYLAVLPGIAEYLCTSLERVARDKVKVRIISPDKVPEKKQSFSDMSLTLASVRLDALLSGMLNISRDKAKKLIASGRVGLNHVEIQSCDKEFAEGDIISVKGEGKFVVDAFLGVTVKNRNRVIVRKYL